jgi:hypothetical protein
MRGLLALAVFVAGIGVAAAQAPQQRPNNANLRAVPDGPGVRSAELQGLDKVTARTQRFYVPVGKATRFGTLEITVSDCLVNVPEAPPESVAYLTIVDHKPGQAEEKLFAGWMFASTPSLSALDHGVYDLRVLSCTMAQGSAPPSSR